MDQVFSELTYAADIAGLGVDIANLQSQISGLADASHTHPISSITSLQSSLDLKASISYVEGIAQGLASDIAAITISDETADVANLQASIDSINATIATLPTQSDLDNKVAGSHTHTVADITDFDQFENALQSTQDTLNTHTHFEADISDLDKYTQAQTDLIFTDHANLKNNPHEVTKEQIGLGNVENKSVAEIFDEASSELARKDEFDVLNSTVTTHLADANPHQINKVTIGLGNVPNINFEDLLNAHIASTNPHNFDFDSFDLYTKAETNTRIQFYLDQARYAYSPTSTDSHGAIGDIAYDTTNLYVKTDSTVWKSLPWVASYNSLTDVPSTFAPSSHNHTWSEITDKPSSFGANAINDLSDVQTSGGVAITANTGFTGTVSFTGGASGTAYGEFKGMYTATGYQLYSNNDTFRLAHLSSGTADVVAYDDDDIMNTLNDGWVITNVVKTSSVVTSFDLEFTGTMSHVPSTGQVLAWNEGHSHWMPMTLDVLGTRTLSVQFADTTSAKDLYIPIPNDGVATKIQGVLSDALTATAGFLTFTFTNPSGTQLAQIAFASGASAGNVQSVIPTSNVLDGGTYIKVTCDGGADTHVDCAIVVCVDE